MGAAMTTSPNSKPQHGLVYEVAVHGEPPEGADVLWGTQIRHPGEGIVWSPTRDRDTHWMLAPEPAELPEESVQIRRKFALWLKSHFEERVGPPGGPDYAPEQREAYDAVIELVDALNFPALQPAPEFTGTQDKGGRER